MIASFHLFFNYFIYGKEISLAIYYHIILYIQYI